MKHVYVIFIVPATLLIPLAAATGKSVLRFRPLRVIYVYLLFVVSIEILSRVVGARGINNLPLLHIYTIIEFLFMMCFFMLAIPNQAISRLALWLMAGFTLCCIFDFSFIQHMNQFNTYPRTLAALIISGFCMYFFYTNAAPEEEKPWAHNPLNWVVTGLLVYFGSSFFHFAFQNVLFQKASLTVNYFFAYLHATLVMVMYFFFTAGFIYARRQR
ncbi:MAG: hypothetical protein V4553_06830 [Bacteroidota bacterium]